MSTKTNFKRIALVAVAALGLSLFSSVPSQAAVTGLTVSAVNGTAALGQANDTVTAAVVSVQGLATVGTGDTITVTFVPKGALPAAAVANMVFFDTKTSTPGTNVALTVTTNNATVSSTTGATATTTTLAVADTATAGAAGYAIRHIGAAGYMSARFKVQLDSSTVSRSTAGTYTYTAIATPYVGGVAGTSATADFTITIAETAAESTTVDPSKSTAFLAGSATPTADAAVSAVATASSTAAGYLSVRTYNASSIAAAESITVTIAGAGTLYHASGVTGTSFTVKASGSDGDFEVRPDGRAGTATITVSTPTKTFAAKSMNFYAKSAKTITATVATPLLAIGSNAGAVRATAVDANNVAWTGTAYIVASSAADAAVAGSTTPVSCGTYDSVNARFNCPITAVAAGTAKFKIIDAATVAAATATSNEVTVTVSNATAASVKLEFDKATYAPNERARIYVTPLDSTGKPMQSATYTNLLATGGMTLIGAVSYTGTTTTADSLTATSFTTAAQTNATTGAKAGSMQFTVYMPSAGGTVTLSATGGTSLPLAGQVAVTASATVTDSGAQALAAVNALATTVASLRTLITTLTNLVLKIQKKVKA